MKKTGRTFLILLLWLGIWQGSYWIVGHDVLLASPGDTLTTLFSLAKESRFWNSILFSMGRIVLGLCLGLVVGTTLAVLTTLSKFCYDFFKPLISIIQATPVVSFTILALVWLSTGALPVFMSFLIVLPIVWTNVTKGIKQTDSQLLEMAKAYKMSGLSKVRHIYIPSILPYFQAAVMNGIGLAWKAGITAEVLATPYFSIGQGIYNAKIYLNTTELFAWTIMVILLSLLLEKVIITFINKNPNKVVNL